MNFKDKVLNILKTKEYIKNPDEVADFLDRYKNGQWLYQSPLIRNFGLNYQDACNLLETLYNNDLLYRYKFAVCNNCDVKIDVSEEDMVNGYIICPCCDIKSKINSVYQYQVRR